MLVSIVTLCYYSLTSSTLLISDERNLIKSYAAVIFMEDFSVILKGFLSNITQQVHVGCNEASFHRTSLTVTSRSRWSFVKEFSNFYSSDQNHPFWNKNKKTTTKTKKTTTVKLWTTAVSPGRTGALTLPGFCCLKADVSWRKSLRESLSWGPVPDRLSWPESMISQLRDETQR